LNKNNYFQLYIDYIIGFSYSYSVNFIAIDNKAIVYPILDNNINDSEIAWNICPIILLIIKKLNNIR
jgi:hypothetical protein